MTRVATGATLAKTMFTCTASLVTALRDRGAGVLAACSGRRSTAVCMPGNRQMGGGAMLARLCA